MGQSPDRLPRRERPAPCDQRAVAVAGPGTPANPGALAGGDALRRPPDLRSLSRLDLGAEEHPVAPFLPAELPAVSAARLQPSDFGPRISAFPSSFGFRPSDFHQLLPFAPRICAGAAEQDFDGDAAGRAAGLRVVAARSHHAGGIGCAPAHSSCSRWCSGSDEHLVSGARGHRRGNRPDRDTFGDGWPEPGWRFGSTSAKRCCR